MVNIVNNFTIILVDHHRQFHFERANIKTLYFIAIIYETVRLLFDNMRIFEHSNTSFKISY